MLRLKLSIVLLDMYGRLFEINTVAIHNSLTPPTIHELMPLLLELIAPYPPDLLILRSCLPDLQYPCLIPPLFHKYHVLVLLLLHKCLLLVL